MAPHLSELLLKLTELANTQADGHYTIAKFTTNYRVLLGTPMEWNDWAAVPPGQTLEEAIGQCLLQYTMQHESVPEAKFHQAWLAEASSIPLVAQHTVTLDGVTMRFDFAVPSRQVAIEIDGYEWHSSKEKFQHDRQRDRIAMKYNWLVVRLAAVDVLKHPVKSVQEVYAIITGRPLIVLADDCDESIDTNDDYDLGTIKDVLKQTNCGFMLTALDEAEHLHYNPVTHCLTVRFSEENGFSDRIRGSRILFEQLGWALFGAPIRVNVQISPKERVI